MVGQPMQRRTRFGGFSWLLALLAGLACAAPRAGAVEFTPAQRAEIVTILRDALMQDPRILRDAVEALQAAEQDHQEAAQRKALAANAAALIDPADPVAGNPKGDVTIVEFFDVRCPYCKRIEQPMAELLRSDGNIRLVYKDLPVLGPASMLGARALLAAQRQGGYEKLREAVMALAQVTRDGVLAEAKRIGLDTERLTRDMEDPAIEQRLRRNLQLATALGIQGTPALVLGERMIPGAIELTDMRRLVIEARQARR